MFSKLFRKDGEKKFSVAQEVLADVTVSALMERFNSQEPAIRRRIAKEAWGAIKKYRAMSGGEVEEWAFKTIWIPGLGVGTGEQYDRGFYGRFWDGFRSETGLENRSYHQIRDRYTEDERFSLGAGYMTRTVFGELLKSAKDGKAAITEVQLNTLMHAADDFGVQLRNATHGGDQMRSVVLRAVATYQAFVPVTERQYKGFEKSLIFAAYLFLAHRHWDKTMTEELGRYQTEAK